VSVIALVFLLAVFVAGFLAGYLAATIRATKHLREANDLAAMARRVLERGAP
jgi:hypothetical protein